MKQADGSNHAMALTPPSGGTLPLLTLVSSSGAYTRFNLKLLLFSW